MLLATVERRAVLSEAVASARAQGARVALVPTMGFLHEGHLSLVDRARAAADYTVVSIFVNPLQFGPHEDLATYPRDLDRDLDLLRRRGADLVFVPDVAEMYPAREPGVYVHAPALADRLCGASRPGHFQGVLTVVAKLLHVAAPDVAVFGRKDLQQLVLVRRMVRDLDFGVRIIAGAIVRDADGLALSSRNVYLTAAQREQALLLSRGLVAARDAFAAGERDAARLVGTARGMLERGTDVRVDYVELIDTTTLDAVARASPQDALAVAAWVGRTRLIDNITIGGHDVEQVENGEEDERS